MASVGTRYIAHGKVDADGRLVEATALLDGASIIDVAPGLLIVAVSAVVTLSVGVLAFRAAVARERPT